MNYQVIIDKNASKVIDKLEKPLQSAIRKAIKQLTSHVTQNWFLACFQQAFRASRRLATSIYGVVANSSIFAGRFNAAFLPLELSFFDGSSHFKGR